MLVLQARKAGKRGVLTPWQVALATIRADAGFAISSQAEPFPDLDASIEHLSPEIIRTFYQPPFLQAGAASRNDHELDSANFLFRSGVGLANDNQFRFKQIDAPGTPDSLTPPGSTPSSASSHDDTQSPDLSRTSQLAINALVSRNTRHVGWKGSLKDGQQAAIVEQSEGDGRETELAASRVIKNQV